MNAKTKFSKLNLSAGIEMIELADMILSPLNPRQDVNEETIALLAKSLVVCGLAQNLVGLRGADGKVEITSGGRRLRALQIAVQERPDLSPVPVKIALNEEDAVRMAAAENVAREAMEPVDEIMAYGKMAKAGSTVAQIASAFGVTEPHVYRRLKLCTLPVEVLDALRARKISLDQAAAFTISDDEGRILEVLGLCLGRHSLSASEIRSRLKIEAVHGGSRRAVFVGAEAYKAAGGTITQDLFQDTVFFNEPDLLNRLYDEKLTAEVAAMQAEGWAWVHVEDGSYFSRWNTPWQALRGQPVPLSEEDASRLCALEDLEEPTEAEEDEMRALQDKEGETLPFDLETKALAGMVIYVDHAGHLRSEGPFVKPEQVEQAVALDALPASAAVGLIVGEEPKKSPFSQAVKDDLKAVELHAFQTALRQNPKLALALLAFSLSDQSGGGSLFGFRVEEPKNLPSDEDGLQVDEALRFAGENKWTVKADSEAFATFNQRSEAEIMDVLIAGAVRTLHTGFGYGGGKGDLFEHLTKALNVDMRAIWTPTKSAFWGRMPGSYLDATFLDLTGMNPDGEGAKVFIKLKKGEKAAQMESLFTDAEYQKIVGLTPEQIERIANWRPEAE